MWIVYHKTDKKIVGLSADCEPDLDKAVALGEVVKGLINPRPLDEYDAIQVSDRTQASAFMNAFPDKLVLREGSDGHLELAIEEPKIFFLRLQCDAADVHPVDGIPEIPADGTSSTTITVQKIDESGELQQAENDNDLLYLRTDWGSLRSSDGQAEIGQIKLEKGQAKFQLFSEKAKRVATVQVFNADNSLLNSSIRIEFI